MLRFGGIYMNDKKVLVLGGTGAMGVYVVPELLRLGYKTDVVALDNIGVDNDCLRFIKKNGKDISALTEILKNDYDAIIDFMLYTTDEFKDRYELFLKNTKHYIFLSSYRVYADKDKIITENSPRLISVSKDEEFIKSDDYAMAKCRQENILENSPFMNWTIVRPSIVYSKGRFQLVAYEANIFVARALQNKKVTLQKEAMDVQATMTWAGDIAKMITRLILNPGAYREKFTLSTAEHNSWRYVKNCYERIIGLQIEEVDYDTYMKIRVCKPEQYNSLKWQIDYDRLFNRIVDNSKILAVTGLKQKDFMPLEKGLETELNSLPKDWKWNENEEVSKKMDQYLADKLL